MSRKISSRGLLLSMFALLGGDTPLPEPSLYRAPETRRRSAPTPVERPKTQRELDAEAKRARRRERNLRHAAKTAPVVVVLESTGDYLDDNYFEGVDFKEVPEATLSPVKLTPNQKILLTHLEFSYDRPVSEILPYFPTPQSARATIVAAVKVGLVEVLGVLIRVTSFGVVSLNAAR